MNRFLAGLILFVFYACNSNESIQNKSIIEPIDSIIIDTNPDSVDIISTELLDTLQVDLLEDVILVEEILTESIKTETPKKKSDPQDKISNSNPFDTAPSGTGADLFGYVGSGDGGIGYGDGVGTGSSDYEINFNPSRKITFSGNKPKHTNEEGIIAYDLWVNAQGDVVRIKLNYTYSNTTNGDLINLAKKWAYTIKYEVSNNSNQQEFVGHQLFEFKSDSLH